MRVQKGLTGARKGCCLHCHSTDNQKDHINLGRKGREFGDLILCRTCVEQAATLLGWLPPGSTADLQEELIIKRNRIEELLPKAEEYDRLQLAVEGFLAVKH